MAVASILVSEADPDVRRLLVVIVERHGLEAIVLGPDVVVPPRADVLVVDPVAPASLIHARLVREHSPGMPVLCLNPIPHGGVLPGHGTVAYLPKPFAAELLDSALDDVLCSAGSPV